MTEIKTFQATWVKCKLVVIFTSFWVFEPRTCAPVRGIGSLCRPREPVCNVIADYWDDLNWWVRPPFAITRVTTLRWRLGGYHVEWLVKIRSYFMEVAQECWEFQLSLRIGEAPISSSFVWKPVKSNNQTRENRQVQSLQLKLYRKWGPSVLHITWW